MSKLSSSNIGLTSTTAWDDIWDERYNMLLAYSAIHGHCNIPHELNCTISDGKIVRLGWWLVNQRKAKRRNMLREDRVQRLQHLVNEGLLKWDMDIPKVSSDTHRDNETWQIHYDALVDYGSNNNGDYNIPQKMIYLTSDNIELRLGEWLARQRKCKRKNKLLDERKMKLQKLVNLGGLCWNIL